MARTRILLSLDPATYDELKRDAARQKTLPATLAAELIARSLAGTKGAHAEQRPAAALKGWIEPYLDEIREAGGWPPDITLQVFDRIRDEAIDLYNAAIADVGRDALNRELGRMVKERLGARVMVRDGRPRRIKVSPKRGSLIQLATLLETEPDHKE